MQVNYKKPLEVRYNKTELRCRVSGDLRLRSESEGLTSYAGLELIRQYFLKLSLVEQIRRHAGRYLPRSDYGSISMLLLVLTLIISGDRRVRHIGYMDSDPVVLRCFGLKRLLSGSTLGGWLEWRMDGAFFRVLLCSFQEIT